MKIIKEVVGHKLDEVICDVCGDSCKKTCDNEFASIIANWGYDSNKDLMRFDIELCEGCFDKTIAFLKSIRTTTPDSDDPFEGREEILGMGF